MQTALESASVAIHAKGVNAFDYVARLENLRSRTKHEAGSASESDIERQLQLELQLDRTLISGVANEFVHAPGADDRIVAFPGGFSDPIATYVPSAPEPDGKYRLVVILHGAGETEADVVSRSAFQDLAEANHAIVVAPWGDGDDLWGQRAIDEILTAMQRAESTFHIDVKRRYLVGISMGGAGAFHVAATHADRFTAIMTIVGDLAGPDSRAVRTTLRDTNVYLVEGGKDPIMGPRANAYTYRTLARACVPVSLYLAPDAGHSIYETEPELRQAWSDMFSGIVRNGSSSECTPAVDAPT